MKKVLSQLGITNKVIGIYIVWITINLLIALFTSQQFFEYDDDFAPFSEGLRDYDYSEFIFYTIIPVLLFVAYKLINSEKKNKTKDV